MYLREAHVEHSIPALRQLIRDNPLGILTSAIPSPTYPLLQSSHIPFLLDVDDDSSATELGRLRGHLARQNPHSKAMIEALLASSSSFLSDEVLVLFTSPVQHYVTPKFYVETKPVTGKVVPTWNYAAAQVYGRAKVYFDSHDDETAAFLARQIDDLSTMAERDIMYHTGEQGRPAPWRVADAPEGYIGLMRKNIVGIEIVVERLEGKFKMSQELKEGDRDGVVHGFRALGSDIGNDMAELVKTRSELKKAAIQR